MVMGYWIVVPELANGVTRKGLVIFKVNALTSNHETIGPEVLISLNP
jgi:hypothetical protein